MNRTLMIDGDIVLFQVGRVTEDVTQFGDMLCESYDEEACIRLLDNELDKIADKTGYSKEEMVFAISCTKNFRKRFFPTYKNNRKNVKKPIGLKFLRQYTLDNAEKFNTLMIEELEADDAMGIYGTAPSEASGTEIAIYSQDKDLKTIPCKQWDFKLNKFITPTPMEACKFLYTQVLMGDAVDGYKGCPKIGKVKAAKALLECETELEMLKAAHALFEKVYGDEAKEKLKEQMGQARILHHSDSILLFGYDTLYNPYEMLEGVHEMFKV